MERVWFTIENIDGHEYNSDDDVFYSPSVELASEFDEYNDAALVAEGLRGCSVIRHRRPFGGVHHTEVAGDF